MKEKKRPTMQCVGTASNLGTLKEAGREKGKAANMRTIKQLGGT